MKHTPGFYNRSAQESHTYVQTVIFEKETAEGKDTRHKATGISTSISHHFDVNICKYMQNQTVTSTRQTQEQ